MADWSQLSLVLSSVDRSARYTWVELDALVGGLPPSAANHRAWWSGNRPHVNEWRRAGFTVVNLVPGREVTFVRRAVELDLVASPDPSVEGRNMASLLLVTCVKQKQRVPAAARDLYVSPLFQKERAYAEASGLPWFILSAEHGLVAPDDWLAPYERYLPDTPASYRKAWAAWVVERLELVAGPLLRRVVEVHASSSYVDALRGPLAAKGADLVEPLAGLTMGQRLAWYDGARRTATEPMAEPPVDLGDGVHISAADFCGRLTDVAAAVTPREFVDRGPEGFRVPGVYSWWTNVDGAADLSRGLGLTVEPGLIYAGLAGATRWPSGRRSSNTLWSRIVGMHLGKKHEFSTFRRTLGSILADAAGDPTIDEVRLTAWMHARLRVIAAPFEDADTLGRLEESVLAELDPPLNLKGMGPSPIRVRVRELRRQHARKPRGPS